MSFPAGIEQAIDQMRFSMTVRIDDELRQAYRAGMNDAIVLAVAGAIVGGEPSTMFGEPIVVDVSKIAEHRRPFFTRAAVDALARSNAALS